MNCKKMLAALLTAVLLFSLCACNDQEATPTGSSETTVTDMVGRQVTVTPGNYKKVVCIGAGALRMYSYIGDAPSSYRYLPQPQLRRPQMSADQTGIRADSLYERILRTFHRILERRRRRTGLNLEGQGAGLRKQDHAKAVDQHQGSIIQVSARPYYTIIYSTFQSRVIQCLHGRTTQMLRHRSEHILRDITTGGEPVDGVGPQALGAASQSADREVCHIPEEPHHLLMTECLFHSSHLQWRVYPGIIVFICFFSEEMV